MQALRITERFRRSRGEVPAVDGLVIAVGSGVAIADPANPASAHVLDKLGIQLPGRRIAYGGTHLPYRVSRAARK
jgi:hypothetical protein